MILQRVCCARHGISASAVVPEPETLAPLLGLIGWQGVERQGNIVRLSVAGMELDFGGIGKEYAADRAATLLYRQGVRHGYVNLAGDVRVVGPKPDGSPWIIGIQDPRHKERTIASIPLTAGALATSGDYERFFDLDGHRYCHILHPQNRISGHIVAISNSCSTFSDYRRKLFDHSDVERG